jgi:hypothetical protein
MDMVCLWNICVNTLHKGDIIFHLIIIIIIIIMREELRLRGFQNRVLRRIFWPKRDEVTGEWRKLHTEELNNLYCSPTIVRVIKSRGMGWAAYVECMWREEA